MKKPEGSEAWSKRQRKRGWGGKRSPNTQSLTSAAIITGTFSPDRGFTGLRQRGFFHFCFLEFVNNWLSRCQLLCFLQTCFPTPPPPHKHLSNKTPPGPPQLSSAFTLQGWPWRSRARRWRIGKERLRVEKFPLQN